MKTHRNDELGIVYGWGMISGVQDPSGNWHPFEDTYDTHFSQRCCEEIALGQVSRTITFGNGTTIRSPFQNQHSSSIIGDIPFVMPISPEIVDIIRNTDIPVSGVLIGARPHSEYRDAVLHDLRNDPNGRFSVGALINRQGKKKKKGENYDS